jgi:hypothetical protein
LLAACEQTGVQFIVEIPADFGADGDPQVQLPDEVRLFIGMGEEFPTSIAPEGFDLGDARPGTFWLRDPSNLGPEVDRAPIGIDSPAVFSYTRAGGVDELGVVIAVGYTNGVPTSSVAEFHARVGGSRVFQYRMGLNAAANPRDRLMRSRVNQLELWGTDECVFAENRRADLEDQGHKVAFIVGSAEDRDCDGLINTDPLECFPQVHMGVGIAFRPSCLHTDSIKGDCVIGVPNCRDGTGIDQSCNPTRFCLAQEVCQSCDAGDDQWNCAQDVQMHNAATVGSYGLDCTVHAVVSGTDFDLCTDELPVSITPPPNTTCQTVLVKSVDDATFDDTFWLAGTGKSASMKVSANDCALKIEPMGRLALTNPVPTAVDFGALMLVRLDMQRGLGVPVHVKVVRTTSCVDRGACTWVDNGAPDNPNECVARTQP